MTLIGETSVLIGKALGGIASAQALGPRFQHYPPKQTTVELVLQDGSVEILHQAWVKPLLRKLVFLVIVIIVFGMLMLRLGIAASTCFTICPTPHVAIVVIVLNNHFSSLSKF